MKKILIVEDDSFLQGLAATKLGHEGYEVKTASNGDEAIKIISEAPLDMILLDLVLPGTDGYAVLEKVRANPAMANTPIIVFSNLAEDKDIKRAQEYGIKEFLIKSNFTLDELVSKIKALIG